ncbi:TIGR03087 family PEP-CTERM/XrtA system glycosyltransferase [Alteromonas sp. KUL49]|uniref:TIGR03087 family PEP-CTERM/XrtA system glycosyltransferase n=1 Tax=Alteromonas sp. KUL49 TaxID=2480798 RepID=UPI00102F11D1|nr:TIGR03087 family PEP-CTERM/XrtA system glycosyltransferase [Alteromonas sp. KUL49]TAP41431.1 TIGR03087 family PEP-CTERM/XrtA system glycosyltransferase [Alteromonas sp. KUL49]GEA10504.1 glycosyl transferase [Alteromonas sp. KUL49]
MAKKLTICVVSQRVPYPPNKGEKLRTFHQIERLLALGHNVTVLSLCDGDAESDNAKALAEVCGIEVIPFRTRSKPVQYAWALLNQQPISVGAFYSPSLQRYIDESLSGRFDVMFLSASSLGYYVFNSVAYERRQCRLFMDMMDVDSDKWLQYCDNSRWPMNWVYKRESVGIRYLERRACEEFEATFLIAEEEVKLFNTQVSRAKKVTVLGNGLDFSSFYPPDSTNDAQSPRYLFTGVMDYKPNIDAVVWFVEHCWSAIKLRYPDAKFTIAGMNPTQEIQTLGDNDPNIEVTGFVDDILPYFHQATAFVAPFRLARGVQNKVLQAAACALPIVTTSMGAEGISFAGPTTMWIVDDTQSFIEACIQTMEDRVAGIEKGQAALNALSASYSWENQLLPLEEALNN